MNRSIASRKIAAETAEWYFTEYDIDESEHLSQRLAGQSGRTAEFTAEMWAHLMTEAISSFNQGLEEEIDHEERRASNQDLVQLRQNVIDAVGQDAFQVIAFLVAAQGTRRPLDAWGQASSIYMNIKGEMGQGNIDPGKLRQAAEQIYTLAKTPGLDPQVARDIGGLGAELINYSNDFANRPGTQTQGPLPTGVAIQGKRRKAG